MLKASPELNEWIAKGLEFDPDFGYAHKDFVPRWAISFVRQAIIENNRESSLRREKDVAQYIDTVLCQDRTFVSKLQRMSYGEVYSAVFRKNSLHIFKDNKIRERTGDIILKDEFLDMFMSHLIHPDWRLELGDWWLNDCPLNLLGDALAYEQKHGDFAFYFKMERLNDLPVNIEYETYGG